MNRDLMLGVLAALVGVAYIAAVVVIARSGLPSEVLAAAFGALAPIGPLAGFAIGRVSGAKGEREAS